MSHHLVPKSARAELARLLSTRVAAIAMPPLAATKDTNRTVFKARPVNKKVLESVGVRLAACEVCGERFCFECLHPKIARTFDAALLDCVLRTERPERHSYTLTATHEC